ncbi:MAG: deoxyhypusine synthase, partial [Gemmatimonadetes bacterium]|nr:deoxyhypusine synthase [Gemmatimonadota bacterium]
APRPIGVDELTADTIDNAFLAYNAGRLRDACELFDKRMLRDDVTIGLALSGALTPAGLGMTCIVPLIEAGFVDWIVSTGANLYHDTHFGIGLEMRRGHPQMDDTALYEAGVVRIYDVVFEYDVLLKTDAFFRQLMTADEFQHEMGTAEFHYRAGRYVDERERTLGQSGSSVLAAAYRNGVPIYTSSPGDSSIGMNIAEMELRGYKLKINPSVDVIETTAIVFDAKQKDGRSAVMIMGGGSPKNFVLQTEPQIQEIMGLGEAGHDYYLQVTDARPDTGGLSGATPSEAVSWGKVDPNRLPDAVVCYCDTTIALPLLTAYALDRHPPRQPQRLYDRREELSDQLRMAYESAAGDRQPGEVIDKPR